MVARWGEMGVSAMPYAGALLPPAGSTLVLERKAERFESDQLRRPAGCRQRARRSFIYVGMPNRVVHFEIEATDRERAKRFYAQAFEWGLEQMDDAMGAYVVVTTGDPKEPGGINGGIYTNPGAQAKEVNAYRCVIGVDNVKMAVDKVKSAGGEVIDEPMDIPGIGTYVRCKDTEGNFFTMLQPLPTSM